MTNNGAVIYARVATAEQLRGFKAGLHEGVDSHGYEESAFASQNENVEVKTQEEIQKGREDK